MVKIFFKTLRFILTPIILLWDKVTSPSGITRSTEEQNELDRKTQNLYLYQFKACPFCIKVRRQIKRQSLKIQTRDAQYNEAWRNELASNGGQVKVPCLKIVDDNGNATWMYESSDIIAYLQEKFA